MPRSLRPEHVLATILSSTEDGLLSFSLDGAIQLWSAGAERLYGYAAAEITGRPVAMLLPIYEMPACEQFLRAAKDGTFACCENVERLRKDGSRIGVALKRAAVRDETGAVTGIVETARGEGLQVQSPAADEQLHLLAEQMPAILWTTDQNLRITSNLGAGFGHPRAKPTTWRGRRFKTTLNGQVLQPPPSPRMPKAHRGAPLLFRINTATNIFPF